MLNTLAQVTLKSASGFSADDVVNTFALSCSTRDPGGITAAYATEVGTALKRFYDEPLASGGRLSGWISNSITRTGTPHTIELYDITTHLDGSPHGSPAQTWNFGMAAPFAGTGVPLPDEVALALTLRSVDYDEYPVEIPDTADPGSAPDRPRARRTGRIYVGPLIADTVAVVGGKPRPGSGIQADFLDASERLKSELLALSTGATQWCVWSRKNGGMFPLEAVQVDNAYDTQRRRGPAATVRQTRAVVVS